MPDTSVNQAPLVSCEPADTKRLNGKRYVSGEIRYLDDAVPSSCMHLAFVRSPYAHARLRNVDTTRARQIEGVVAVYDGQDTQAAMEQLVCMVPAALSGTPGSLKLPCLTRDLVRYAGEPVAIVVAVEEWLARRAAEQVDVEYDVLPPMLDLKSATAEDAVPQHPDLPGNVAMTGAVTEGNASGALEAAPYVVEGRVLIGRSSAVPLETRGCIAQWDHAQERLVVRVALQTPHSFRADLARQLRLLEGDIHVQTPPLGGAFGFKFAGMPEEPLTCLAALLLKRPVRWVESRAESLIVGAREYEASYRMGLEADGRVTGLIVELAANIGALAATPGPLMAFVAATTFPGPYHIANLDVRWRAVMTNKGPWNGARGYGKEATCLILECAMDTAAGKLGLDPIEMRRRNLLRPEQFPHRTSTMTVDSGDYQAALDLVLSLSGYETRRALAKAARPASQFRLGLGVSFELTPEGFDSGGSLARGFETVTVRLDTSGQATVLTGVTSPGTGSETAIAQLVATQLGLPTSHVRVVQGDTDTTPYGSGSFSSRAVITAGTAAWLSAGDLRAALTKAAAILLRAEPLEIEVADGFYRVAGQPGRCVPVGHLPRMLRSLGQAIPGIGEPQLEATRTYGPQNLQSIPDEAGRLQIYPTYSYSVHVAEVEVDLETGATKLVNFTAVHDCGTVINRSMVDGQLHGAIAMGIGLALYEEESYGPGGVGQSVGFKHYMVPRVKDVPDIRIGHICTPSPFTRLGTKGAGESGVGGAAAAIVGAIRDAVGGNDKSVQLPMTPPRVFRQISAARLEAS